MNNQQRIVLFWSFGMGYWFVISGFASCLLQKNINKEKYSIFMISPRIMHTKEDHEYFVAKLVLDYLHVI